MKDDPLCKCGHDFSEHDDNLECQGKVAHETCTCLLFREAK